MDRLAYRTGDIILVDFHGIGHQQRGIRPAIIVSNNVGNKFAPIIEVIPFTTQKQDKNMPTHVKFKASKETGLIEDSILLAENKTSINKFQIIKKLGAANEDQLDAVACAMAMATPIILRAFKKGIEQNSKFVTISTR